MASLHEGPDVQVQKRVRLPTVFNPTKKREIDVLVTGSVAGHRVRVAIECKNEKGPVGTKEVGNFESKLRQVGIPRELGIMVSANGYTGDALEHARSVNVKTLVLRGLTEDRLSIVVDEAIQSVIYLLADVVSFWLMNDLNEPITAIDEAFVLYDEQGRPAGTLPDFVWQEVRTGRLEPTVGRHVLELQVPEGWHNVIGGQIRPIRHISVNVNVLGLLLTVQGRVQRHTLVNAVDEVAERSRVHAAWRPAEGRYTLRTFASEQDLGRYVQSESRFQLVKRQWLPRIRFWHMMYWPPSQRVADIVQQRMGDFRKGRIPDPRPFDFAELEGNDLSTAWEPISRDYTCEAA